MSGFVGRWLSSFCRLTVVGIGKHNIASVTKLPGRVVGMHWSNPPHLIPMIEVIPGERTGASVVEATTELVRSFGYRLGKRRIRINSISQSPTRTVAGSGIAGFDAMFEFAERIAPLGNADAASCADYTVTLLSDLTRMVTMQTLFHDGGFMMYPLLLESLLGLGVIIAKIYVLWVARRDTQRTLDTVAESSIGRDGRPVQLVDRSPFRPAPTGRCPWSPSGSSTAVATSISASLAMGSGE